jgi:hypothetical protein
VSGALPIRLAPYAGIADSQMLHIVPAARYASVPPGLTGFVPADAVRAQALLRLWARQEVACPAEAVMLYRDALVMDGRYVLAGGVAVADSYYNVPADAAQLARQQAQPARIAAGDIAALPEAGPPVVALFGQDCNNFGHLLAEMLPRLLHLPRVGITRLRLLVPAEAEAFRPMIDFALQAAGLEAETVACPPGSILRVKALHYVSLVGQGWFKSPTVLALFERLRAAAPAAGAVERLFVARPDSGRRRVANAAEAAALAQAMGFTVVEPSVLPFPEQVALFAGARCVAGPFGAALTLIGAMPAGGHVGMLSPGYYDTFYWDLACLAGHRFDWAFTAPVRPFDMALLEGEMMLPARQLRQVLARLER